MARIDRSAVDCMRRAGLSLRANPGLVVLAVVRSVAAGLLFVVSLIPPFLVLGGMDLIEGEWSLAALEEWLTGLSMRLPGQTVPLLLALLASTLLGLLAVFVWAWFQAGVSGTLVAAERQALPDAQDRTGGAQWFRTFGGREFSGWAGRYAWRYFWFFHLGLTIGLLLMLVLALIVFGVGLGYEAWGGGAAYGIGCGAALPFLFAMLVYSFWMATSRPFLALPDGGVQRAAGAGLRIIGRRPGAVLLIVLTLFVFGMALGVAMWLAETSITFATGSGTAVWAVLIVLSSVVRMTFSSILSVFGDASFTSLAVAEAPEVVR